ncbi:MAG: hypothetical protein DI616_08975 [Paracoccus denitrificans]|uniref:Pectate lyase n=1 Tax=Paracoccus denitrificans TaxID=266 RepID=A0A533I989_PARDE|nr:MAG: hypothetical protein DI616_08975 [Paracoccus denitrificans]
MRIIDAKIAGVLGLVLSMMLPAGGSWAQDVAFPGAEGYGAGATAWRGGAMIAVTTLEDRGPGSLRDCVERDGPRICIFQVAGTIHLREPLMVRSDVYVAGQTAPGGGIQLRNDESTHAPMIVADADDVVLRFLKLRPGPSKRKSSTIDALTIENAQRVYLGNLSLMFASDETFSVHVSRSKASDITLADSILAYSLDRSNHPDGRHSKGALICSDEGEPAENECGRISLLRNLFAHHRDRNPDVKATSLGPVEVVNNIFYDPISQFGEFYDLLGDARIAYVGNLALTGPSTNDRAGAAVELIDRTSGNEVTVWAHGNAAGDCVGDAQLPILDPIAESLQSDDPIDLTMTPMPVNDLLALLPKNVGDAMPDRRHRDELDKKVLKGLANCEGRVINHPQDIGGWPEIAPATAPDDSDGDMLPDEWEAGRDGLDPDQPDDPWQDADGDGLSAVETWLAELAGDI